MAELFRGGGDFFVGSGQSGQEGENFTYYGALGSGVRR